LIGKAAKAEKVAALHTKFAQAKGAILADYRGLNVQQMTELRSRLHAAAVEVDHFVGPTSVAFTISDVVAMAKVLSEYARTEPKLAIRAGLIEGKVISPTDVTALADMPPREVLLARLLAGMQSPLTGLVGVLQGVVRQLLYALLAIREVKEGQSRS
jgi:large subunit ribosomal protein L10